MAEAISASVIDVAEENFDREVIERSRQVPIVVDFWAPWCGPCRALGPILERLVKERPGQVVLAKVNIDQAPHLAAEFGIEAIPAVQAFRDGRPAGGFVGVLPESQLRAFIDKLCPSASDRLAKEAAELEQMDPKRAEAMYRQVLESQRDHEAALVGLARLRIQAGASAEATELLARAAPGGPLAAEVDRLTGLLALQELRTKYGDEAAARKRLAGAPRDARSLFEAGCAIAAAGKYEEALKLLLQAAESDRALARDEVKPVMLQLFRVIGARSRLADDYRDKLARLLY